MNRCRRLVDQFLRASQSQPTPPMPVLDARWVRLRPSKLRTELSQIDPADAERVRLFVADYRRARWEDIDEDEPVEAMDHRGALQFARGMDRERTVKRTAKPLGDCPRCGGHGSIRAFRHRAGGVCFACDGTGNLPILKFGSANVIPLTFTGPHDSIKAGLDTSGKDAVYFRAEIPNPDFDPEEYYVIRGVKKWWEKPTKSVAYLTIDLDQKGESYHAGTAWTDDKHRRQGLIRRLYDMAWDYARSKGKGFRSGWVQSPHMARYWESMVSKGKAEPYTDEWTRSNVTDKGWRRVRRESEKMSR